MSTSSEGSFRLLTITSHKLINLAQGPLPSRAIVFRSIFCGSEIWVKGYFELSHFIASLIYLMLSELGSKKYDFFTGTAPKRTFSGSGAKCAESFVFAPKFFY